MDNVRIKQAFIVLSGAAIAKAKPELHASVITCLLRPENEIDTHSRCEGFVTMWRENKGWCEPEYWAAVFEALFTLHYGDAEDMMEQLTTEREWHDPQSRYQMLPVAVTGILAAANWAMKKSEERRNDDFEAALPSGLGKMIAEYARCSPSVGGMAPQSACQRFSAELLAYCGHPRNPRDKRMVREFAVELKKIKEVPEPTEPFINEVLGRLRQMLTPAELIQCICGSLETKYAKQPRAAA